MFAIITIQIETTKEEVTHSKFPIEAADKLAGKIADDYEADVIDVSILED